MTQLNEEHFELHDKNKIERYERQKIKFLEDRIKTLEKTVANLTKRYAEVRTWLEENFRGEENE
jgi:chaperonin cofactor prefoldin